MRWLLVLALLLAASASRAEKWDGDCSRQGTATTAATEDLGTHNIQPGRVACFTFVDTAGTDDAITENSPEFQVGGDGGLVCFDSAVEADAPNAATADLRYCPHGDMPAANPTFQCSLNTAIPQATCLAVDPGVYYIDITAVAPGSLATSRVTIRGLGQD